MARSAPARPWSTGSRRSPARPSTPPTSPPPMRWSDASCARRTPTRAYFSVDTAAAEALEGVVAVVTGETPDSIRRAAHRRERVPARAREGALPRRSGGGGRRHRRGHRGEGARPDPGRVRGPARVLHPQGGAQGGRGRDPRREAKQRAARSARRVRRHRRGFRRSRPGARDDLSPTRRSTTSRWSPTRPWPSTIRSAAT